MIRIDPERCIGCGLCVEDCTSRVFRFKKDKPVVAHEDNCNLCSHCIAVCPKRAITHKGLGSTKVRRIQRKLIDPAVCREISLTRRSIRKYKPKSVSREVIEDILDVARFAPSASNSQNVHYTIITRRALLQEISERIFRYGDRIYEIYKQKPVQRAKNFVQKFEFIKSLDGYAASWQDYRELVQQGKDLIFHSAPVLLLLHAPRRQGFGCENCMIAATHIDNYAHALGLGTCFIGILTAGLQVDRSMNRKLGIPRGHKVYAALTLGYPDIRYTYHVMRKSPPAQWLSDEESVGKTK